MKKILLMLILVVMVCGCTGTKIEQDVSQDKYLGCTYMVVSRLWVYTKDNFWNGGSIEESIYSTILSYEEAIIEKARQYKVLSDYKVRLDKAIKKEACKPTYK